MTNPTQQGALDRAVAAGRKARMEALALAENARELDAARLEAIGFRAALKSLLSDPSRAELVGAIARRYFKRQESAGGTKDWIEADWADPLADGRAAAQDVLSALEAHLLGGDG